MEQLNQGPRKFYELPNYGRSTKLPDGKSDPEVLAKLIRENTIGQGKMFQGPFGKRKIVYCDYIASGRSLRFIEDFILNEVLTYYGNTHTTTSVTSLQSTMYRHEARDIIRNAVNASEHDAIIFTGNGSTGSVHKLVHAMKPLLASGKVAVLASLFEHHSNLLPWRESGARVTFVNETEEGLVNIEHLEEELQRLTQSGFKIIGTFCAASNITGQLNDDLAITAMLHKYGALAFWDYATAAPYVTIDMNPKPANDNAGLSAKDAIFFSMHKFIGGVQTPGILVVKKDLINQSMAPKDGGGGGTVFFVTERDHRFLKDAELREEGGTPAIVESIRAGMVMQLRRAVGEDFILNREHNLLERARMRLSNLENFVVLGNTLSTKNSRGHLPVLSFLINGPKSVGGFLHYNFVCALLNDLFGIQSRGGCACSGPYAQRLLGMDHELAKSYEKLLLEDERLDRVHLRRGQSEYSQFEVLRPGFTRLSLPWFFTDDEVDFVLSAIEFVASDGWRLLPQYIFNNETGEWKHHTDQVFKDRKWLGNISYQMGEFEFLQKISTEEPDEVTSIDSVLSEAKSISINATKSAQKVHISDQTLLFNGVEYLRWFMLPSEAKIHLMSSESTKPGLKPPFYPKTYAKSEVLQHHIGTYSGKNVSLVLKEAKNAQPFKIKDFLQSDQLNGANKSGLIEIESPSNSVCVRVPKSSNECTLQQKIPENPSESSKLKTKWHPPPKDIFRPFLEAIDEFEMIAPGDRVLVCLSGGKDSLSLLHSIRQYQFYAKKAKNISFEMGAVTVDPQSSAYDPRPLIPYLEELGIEYLYEEQNIMDQAKASGCSSICAFCSRMKRGRIYAAARRKKYNVLALGQHLDDLSESFLMSTFHNGRLRTMKANYTVKEGDLRVIRPFVYVREKDLRLFAESRRLPVIAENCPACFEMPKERHRTKQVLAQQELLFPKLYWSLKTALHPLMSVRETGMENLLFGKNKDERLNDDSDED